LFIKILNSTKMKIFIVNQHLQDHVGGSEKQCDIIARYLTEFGHEVIYYAMNAKKNKYSAKYKVIHASGKLTDFIKTIKYVKPDIVYWRYNKKNLLVTMIILKLLKKKIAFAVSGIDDVKLII